MDKIKYKELITNVSDCLWEVDKNGTYTFCSENVYHFLGFHSHEVIGKTPFDFMSEEEKKRVGQIFLNYIDKKENIIDLENTHLHKNGSEVTVTTNAIPIIDKDGNLLGYQGLDRDITNSKRIERELQKQKDVLEILFEKSSDGVSILENNHFIQHNEKIVSILGYQSKKELLDIHPSKLSPEFQPDGQSSFKKAEQMMNLAIKNEGHIFEWMHIRANGEHFWAEIVLTPISLGDKDIIHVVWRDISKNKAMEIELQNYTDQLNSKIEEEVEKNRKKDQHILNQSRLAQMGEMISMIAHQWRQPLSSIAAISATLSLDITMDKYREDFFQQRLNDIGELSKHLSSTIDDFRDFYKPNKKQALVTLDNVIQKALNIIGNSLENDNIRITSDYSSDIEISLFDNEIKQVLLNILKNSQDNFKEKNIEKARINISTKKNYISISDNGGGIADNILEKIFDPYFSTKCEKDGTGLGLYMSKMIIEEHHNAILNVFNQDNGVCFTIEFFD
ncbi:PAS domain-containing sensor histidine kinase [Sulfurimonas aquatica]|nr:PAS domain S-box protein [Sulfurimonas aquatica]